jgi:Integrase core domain
VRISMDGKGRYLDNIFNERLWRSLEYAEVDLKTYASVAEARVSIGAWLAFYNDERLHQTLDYKTPREIFEAATPMEMWTTQQRALCPHPSAGHSIKLRLTEPLASSAHRRNNNNNNSSSSSSSSSKKGVYAKPEKR